MPSPVPRLSIPLRSKSLRGTTATRIAAVASAAALWRSPTRKQKMSSKEPTKTMNIGPVPASARDGLRRLSFATNKAVGGILVDAAGQVMTDSMPDDAGCRLDATAAIDTLEDGIDGLRQALAGDDQSKPTKTRITFKTTPDAQKRIGAAANECDLSIGHFLMQAALSLNNIGLPKAGAQADEAAQVLDEIDCRVGRLRQLLSIDPEE